MERRPAVTLLRSVVALPCLKGPCPSTLLRKVSPPNSLPRIRLERPSKRFPFRSRDGRPRDAHLQGRDPSRLGVHSRLVVRASQWAIPFAHFRPSYDHDEVPPLEAQVPRAGSFGEGAGAGSADPSIGLSVDHERRQSEARSVARRAGNENHPLKAAREPWCERARADCAVR